MCFNIFNFFILGSLIEALEACLFVCTASSPLGQISDCKLLSYVVSSAQRCVQWWRLSKYNLIQKWPHYYFKCSFHNHQMAQVQCLEVCERAAFCCRREWEVFLFLFFFLKVEIHLNRNFGIEIDLNRVHPIRERLNKGSLFVLLPYYNIIYVIILLEVGCKH